MLLGIRRLGIWMPSSYAVEFVNLIFRILGHQIPPNGLVTFTILEAFDLKAADEIPEEGETKAIEEVLIEQLSKIKEITWHLTVDGFGTFKTFFLSDKALMDKKNRVVDFTAIKIMGLPIEAVPLLEKKLADAFNRPFHKLIGFDIETELNQVRIVYSSNQLAHLFNMLHQQGMALNRIDAGNTLTLSAQVIHQGNTKKRNLLLQKTEKGAKLYLMLDSSLAEPMLDIITEKGDYMKKTTEFVKKTISRFLSATLADLEKNGYEVPAIDL
ncbi:MAG: hypothetical protein D6732_05320 [Methanobacteriota archaeon]|nr:MAG: hypothetical protein D6732_05320 [Euryarchaeota archaeon]